MEPPIKPVRHCHNHETGCRNPSAIQDENNHFYCHPCATVLMLNTLSLLERERAEARSERETGLTERDIQDFLSLLEGIEDSLHNLSWYNTPLHIRMYSVVRSAIRNHRTRRQHNAYSTQLGLYARGRSTDHGLEA